MHISLNLEELLKYDAVYVCGGSTRYLISRMKEAGFKKAMTEYVNHGGIYIGVSAGSIAACGTYESNLGFLTNVLDVHCEKGTKLGPIVNEDQINLTNAQAILITDDTKIIIE